MNRSEKDYESEHERETFLDLITDAEKILGISEVKIDDNDYKRYKEEDKIICNF